MDKEAILSSDLVNRASEINGVIFDTSTGVVGRILENWPNILGAIGILLVGILFGTLIEKLILFIFHKIRLRFLFDRLHFQDFLDKAEIKSSPLQIATKFLKGYIFLMFFLASAKLLKLSSIESFLDSIIDFIPNLVVGLFIVLIGFSFANNTGAFIRNAMKIADAKGGEILGGVAKYLIITFAILGALYQVEVAPEFMNILFIGTVASMALATGLAFGLGGARFVEKRLEMYEKKKEGRGSKKVSKK